MITPREAVFRGRPPLLVQLEELVDHAITKAVDANKWPCTIAVTGEYALYALTMAGVYAAIGWRVQVVDPQKPGEDPFLQFERPTP